MVRGVGKFDGNKDQAFLVMDSAKGYVEDSILQPIFTRLSRIADEFRIKKFELEVPQQKNEVDCGLYVLQFIENILKNENIVKKKDYSGSMEAELSVEVLSRQKLYQLISRGLSYS